MTTRTKIIIGVVILALIGLFIAYVVMRNQDSGSSSDTRNLGRTLIDDELLQSLPKKDASRIDFTHLKDGLPAPTNSWFSGMALQAEPQAIFAHPNSYKMTDDGFAFNLPTVTAEPDVVYGSHIDAATVTFADAERFEVTRYDELTVDVTYYDGQNEEVATVTIGQGLPYAYVIANTDDVEVAVELPSRTSSSDDEKSVVASEGEKQYGLVSPNSTMQVRGTTATTQLRTDDLLTLFTAPDEQSLDTVRKHATTQVIAGAAHYDVQGDTAKTTFTYETPDSNPTLLALLPHQKVASEETSVAYSSIYGTMNTVSANEVTYETPVVSLQFELPIDQLSQDQKKELQRQLTQDVEDLTIEANDTYFGGKQMYRAAQLLSIAEQLGAENEAMKVHSELRQAMDEWFDAPNEDDSTRSFYYDTAVRGVVGVEPSFGSEEFNDHHFHYGYMIYAAAMLAKYDEDFLQKHASFIDLLVADTANYRSEEELPLRRAYDPYVGHSWASGSSPFADGNNQESSSEAVNAWTGVGLWAEVTENKALQEEAAWLLSNEAVTADAYWFGGIEAPEGFDHTAVGINWGGKRDFGTWFSADDNAAVGIQLIPLNPTMQWYEQRQEDRYKSVVADANDSQYRKQFADYLLMYRSMWEPEDALQTARDMSNETIDDGNSRTYLYAWIMSQNR